jgi:hypothetical protein
LLIRSYGDSVLFKSNIKAAMQGERIKGYPILEDVEDRAELYGIEL